MNINTKTFSYFILLTLFVTALGYTQTNDLWTEASSTNLLLFQKSATPTVQTKKEKIYRLDLESLKNQLKNTVSQKNLFSRKAKVLIPFPGTDGTIKDYLITEVATLSPELQEKYPAIKSYMGVSNDTLHTIIRFSISNIGLHSMKLNGNGNSEFIDPYTKDALTYVVYSKSDIDQSNKECKTLDEVENTINYHNRLSSKTSTNNGKSRLFRLALSCTGEYSQWHLTDQGIPTSATDIVKKEAVLSAMNVSITRINGVFEKELALTLQLVSNNDELIFLDPDTDGYTNNDDFALIEEVQAKCNSIIGDANYDIGHLFNIGFSGLAARNSPCTTVKAEAVSGRTPANGDSFDIDFVAHEMGHQFGATHTFNNSCGNNIALETAIEPGSGSTIMGYAGICSPNVQEQSDDYFHAISLEQIYDNIVSGNSQCGAQTDIINTSPTAEAGEDYTIPTNTPFSLLGNGTSGTGTITYSWEQIDNEQGTMPPLGTNSVGPLFRSLEGTSSPERHFPEIATTISGEKGSTWEQLPAVSRTLNFRLTTRDNGLPYGQNAFDDMIINVENTGEIFEVTSQQTAETYYVGESKLVTWEVAGTDLTPINTTLVNILLSTDGGQTFPITLASEVPNNGNHNVIIPNNATSLGRIKIEAVDNVFYNINKENITIETVSFVMTFKEILTRTCSPENAVYQFEYQTISNFNEETTFSVTNLFEGATATFEPQSAVSNGTMVTLIISDTNKASDSFYQPTLIGTATSETNSIDLSLIIDNTIESAPYLSYPKNGATNIETKVEFEWASETEIETNNFAIEIATDVEFSSIIETKNTESNTYTANNLKENSTYFWRVKEVNSCNTSDNSLIYKFKTGTIEEFIYSNQQSIDIPDNDIKGITSVINIKDNIHISDINIKLNVNHPFVADLDIVLINPKGEEIRIAEYRNQIGQNYINTIFDDEAEKSIQQGVAPFTDSFKPLESLSTYNSSNSKGDWTLSIADVDSQGIGYLDNWEITIEGINQNSSPNENNPLDYTPKATKAFSPNDDGINDEWIIENINTITSENDTFPLATIRIFNTQGQVVYYKTNYKNDWKGTDNNGNKLQTGTYFYEVTFPSSGYKTLKGYLYIKY